MAFQKGHKGIGGRPKGTTTKPRLSDFLTEEHVLELVAKARELAAAGDTVMLKFVLEQHFGKAIQPTDITSDGKAINNIVYLPAKPDTNVEAN